MNPILYLFYCYLRLDLVSGLFHNRSDCVINELSSYVDVMLVGVESCWQGTGYFGTIFALGFCVHISDTLEVANGH
jgi:hypothetical protein